MACLFGCFSLADSNAAPKPTVWRLDAVGEYTLGAAIGTGHYGVVRRARHRITGKLVAVKVVAHRDATKHPLEQEVELHSELKHKHIVNFFASVETSDRVYMILELAANGDCYEYMSKHGKFTESRARELFQQFMSAVAHLHNKSIIHRDLKTRNLLLDEKMNVKVSDFGMAIRIHPGEYLTEPCGSPAFVAPELLQKNCSYKGPEVDAWACGVVLYNMLCNQLPFASDRLPSLYSDIKRGKYRVPAHVSLSARDLVRSILVLDQDQRATVSEIHAHEWMHEKAHHTPQIQEQSVAVHSVRPADETATGQSLTRMNTIASSSRSMRSFFTRCRSAEFRAPCRATEPTLSRRHTAQTVAATN